MISTTINGDTFEQSDEMVDATYGGWFGGRADTCMTYIPGLRRYRVNGQPVTEEEFKRRLAQAVEPAS